MTKLTQYDKNWKNEAGCNQINQPSVRRFIILMFELWRVLAFTCIYIQRALLPELQVSGEDLSIGLAQHTRTIRRPT